MSAPQLLCSLIGINPCELSKEENLILEAELFVRLCEELKKNYREEFHTYFRLMKFTIKMEQKMIDEAFVKLIINDILATREYTLQGIAYYTNIHLDVLEELASGFNTNPTVKCLRRTIELHRSVRGELYQRIMKKIAEQCLSYTEQ